MKVKILVNQAKSLQKKKKKEEKKKRVYLSFIQNKQKYIQIISKLCS